jgi:hypothetical protein
VLQRLVVGKAREEWGQGVVLAALSMVVIMAFAAMAIDVGLCLHERRALQNGADTAALAGAQELPSSPGGARQKAAEWAGKNGIGAGELEAIEIKSTYATDDTVTVKVKRDVPYMFARVLGLSSATMSADASARVGSPAAVGGLVPFGVLESAVSFTGPTVLKYDANHVTQGNFGPLAVDGSGANVYQETTEHGSETALCSETEPTCADPTTETQTGNMIGKTRQGIEWRLAHTSSGCNEFHEVFQDVGGTYRVASQCNPFSSLGPDQGSRLVIVPIIEALCNGSCTVTIVNFGMFFIDSLDHCTGNDCQITGRFVDAQADIETLIGKYDPEGLLHFVRLVE